MSIADSKSPVSIISINLSSQALPNSTFYFSRLNGINSASSSSYGSSGSSFYSFSLSESDSSGGNSPLDANFIKSVAVKTLVALGFQTLIFSLLTTLLIGLTSCFSMHSSLEGGLSIFYRLFHHKISYYFSHNSIILIFGVYGKIQNYSSPRTLVPVKTLFFGYSL